MQGLKSVREEPGKECSWERGTDGERERARERDTGNTWAVVNGIRHPPDEGVGVTALLRRVRVLGFVAVLHFLFLFFSMVVLF